MTMPDYYEAANGMQPFDIIDAYDLDFYEGNALKYLIRWRRKNGIADLRKAQTYIDEIIKRAIHQDSGDKKAQRCAHGVELTQKNAQEYDPGGSPGTREDDIVDDTIPGAMETRQPETPPQPANPAIPTIDQPMPASAYPFNSTFNSKITFGTRSLAELTHEVGSQDQNRECLARSKPGVVTESKPGVPCTIKAPGISRAHRFHAQGGR